MFDVSIGIGNIHLIILLLAILRARVYGIEDLYYEAKEK